MQRRSAMKSFIGATLMITGGTGSFGRTVLKHFLKSDIAQINQCLDVIKIVGVGS